MTNEQLRKIINNAPEGATHALIDHKFRVTYAKHKPRILSWFWVIRDSEWTEFNKMPGMHGIHSLADLREILALREENTLLSVENKVLQAKINDLMSNEYLMMSKNSDLDIRKIKSQANVAKSLVNSKFTTEKG